MPHFYAYGLVRYHRALTNCSMVQEALCGNNSKVVGLTNNVHSRIFALLQ